MDELGIFATPFWVNFLIFVPFMVFFLWRKNKCTISIPTLLLTGAFGAAFGVIEASCVIYLRGAMGFLPGAQGTLSDIQQQSVGVYNQAAIATQISPSLLNLELIREAATMVILMSITFLAVKKLKERIAVFLLTFAIWDIVYYVHLYVMVRWPESLLSPDTLFLIPIPWFGQVWYALLVSSLTIGAVLLVTNTKKK